MQRFVLWECSVSLLVTQDRFTDVPLTVLQGQQRNGADVGLVSNPHRDYRHVVPLSTCSVGWKMYSPGLLKPEITMQKTSRSTKNGKPFTL